MYGEFGFPETKRKGNNSYRQEIARKTVGFSDFRSFPESMKIKDFHRKAFTRGR